MTSRKLILLAFIPFLCFGCGNLDKVVVGEIREVKYEAIKNSKIFIEIEVPVKNPSIYRIKIDRINADVMVNNKKIGQIVAMEKVIIPPFSETTRKINLQVQLTNAIGGIITLVNTFRESEISYGISGFIKVKTLLFSKKINIQHGETISLKTKS